MSSWWFLTWTAPEIKDKVVHLTGVEYLYDFINPQQISVPPFVMEYDKKVNPLHIHYRSTCAPCS